MYKEVLLMLVPIVSFSQTLYGLKKTVNGSSTIPFDIVNINPFSGSTSVVLSTNSLIAVAAGASTYDQQNNRYICWGIDSQNNENLYVMDLDNGQTESSLFSSVQAIEMEYDLRTQKAYGLWWDGTSEHFGEIDLSTGLVSSISILPGVSVSGVMLDCTGPTSHPMPVVHLHGTSDGVLPYNGSSDWNSSQSTLDYWISFNNTVSTPTVTSDNNIEHYVYDQGDSLVSVEHYKYIGGEHVWFSTTFQGQNTSKLVWNFVSRYDINGLR